VISLFLQECIVLVTLLSGMLALWNYHLAPISVQIPNKDNTSALCVYWHTAHGVNNPTFGTTDVSMKLKVTKNIIMNFIYLKSFMT